MTLSMVVWNRLVTSLGQLLTIIVTKASSWWEMNTESVFILAIGMEASQLAKVYDT